MGMKNKYIIVGMIALVIGFSGLAIFVYSQMPVLEQKVVDKETSKKRIDEYLLSNPSNLVLNQEAITAFEREKETDEAILYSYRTPMGFEIISYSEKWNTDKLVELYEELLKNEHGQEIELLYQIIVYAEQDEYAAGTHSSELTRLFLEIDFPSLPYSRMWFSQDMGTIRLYNGDEYTKVEEMSHVLSHEYGHHYTFHYMFKNNVIKDTEYEKVRNFPSDVEIFYDCPSQEHYMAQHHWYLIEIAAEDYVQLMGSPTTKNTIYYKDVNQYLYGSENPNYWVARNGMPQENIMLPLAEEVDGLYDYFHKFVSDDYEPAPVLHDEKDINISISRGGSSHEGEKGPLHFNHYKVTWNDAYEGEGVIYTLICYDENDYYLRPIKTVKSGDNLLAYVGTVSRETASYIYWQYDQIDEGEKTFIVTALFPDGTMRVSEPFTYDFN